MATVQNKTFDASCALKFLNLQESAERRGIDFNITLRSIINLKRSKKCYYTGVPLTPKNWSVDRVDNEKGYVIGNVVACEEEFNKRKGRISIKDIRAMQKALKR